MPRRLILLFGSVLFVIVACGSTATVAPAPASPPAAAAPRTSAEPVAPRDATSAAQPAAAAKSFAASSGRSAGLPATLAIGVSSLRLPTPTTRAVAFPAASGLVLAGGLTASGTTGRVVRLPLDGLPAVTLGRLAFPVHDAAGASLHGSMLVLGGGASTQDAWVQRVVGGRAVVTGRLPAARADLAAVSTGAQVIVVGGGASGRADPRVLATSDGIHFHVVASLPVAVRYAAVALVDSTVLVIGGSSSMGDVAVIQAVDLRRGTARIVGRLPQTTSHATALVIRGIVVVAGGRHRGQALDSVLEVDPGSFAVWSAGHLPRPASDSAGVVVGDVGYLVGGEAIRPLATIVSVAVAG